MRSNSRVLVAPPAMVVLLVHHNGRGRHGLVQSWKLRQQVAALLRRGGPGHHTPSGGDVGGSLEHTLLLMLMVVVSARVASRHAAARGVLVLSRAASDGDARRRPRPDERKERV